MIDEHREMKTQGWLLSFGGPGFLVFLFTFIGDNVVLIVFYIRWSSIIECEEVVTCER